MELFAQIRREFRVDGLSIRELAKRHVVGRDTVRQALESAEPPPRKTPVRQSPKLGPIKPVIDQMLIEDLTAPRKQKHTATRIFNRLVEEHGVMDLSYSSVKTYVRARRPIIEDEYGNGFSREVFIPQEHAPGAEAEVDFADVLVDWAGVRTKLYLFTLRLSSSGKAIHRVYPTLSQEAFLQGHVEAFEELGGIPTKHIRYDNLTAAVTRVLFGKGRHRDENDRWVLFRSHYGFDPFYCRPGVEGAHEKGGVEGEGGRFRRNRLVPVPEISSLAGFNTQLRAWYAQDDSRRINQRIRTIGEDFAIEQPLLASLPFEAFDPGLILTPRVDRSALITVRNVKYSVPARYIGRNLRVSLQACEVVVYDGKKRVATHGRIVAKGGQSVQLDHYLEVLKTKPGAFPGSTALAAARQSGAFTNAHDAFWAAARHINGDADGTRELIDVLLLHRHLDHADVEAGIREALLVGSVNAEVVAVQARRHAATHPVEANTGFRRAAQQEVNVQKVISLTQRRLTDPAAVIAGLPADKRPLPTVNVYDQLLPKHQAAKVAAQNRQQLPAPIVKDVS